MDLKKEYNLEIEPKVEKIFWPISIYDFLEKVGFDLSIPGRIYVDKSLKNGNELIYEYNNKKYNIYVYADNYIEIVEYFYYFNEDDEQKRYKNSQALYKINRNFLGKVLSIETKHLEINTYCYYKKNENGELIETSHENCELSFPHQEACFPQKRCWAIRVGDYYYNEKFPYHINLVYNHYGDKVLDIKVDVINQRLKEYFANINMDIPLIDVIKKICEINLITLDDLMSGYLVFGITKNKENKKDNESKYLTIKDGILKITEDGQTLEYVKDYVPKLQSKTTKR